MAWPSLRAIRGTRSVLIDGVQRPRPWPVSYAIPRRYISAGAAASRISMRALVLVGTALFGFSTYAKHSYDDLLRREDFKKKVHKDTSQANIRVKRQVEDKVSLLYKDEDGTRKVVIVEGDKYSHFVKDQIHELNESRGELYKAAEKALDEQLKPVFDKLESRVDRFADWYFSYPTTYKLLSKATTSAMRHTVKILPSEMTIADAVAHDVVKYLQKQYEHIVLRPEITDTQLQQAYVDSLKQAHSAYKKVVARSNERFQEFIAKNTSHMAEPDEKDVHLALDWDSQLNKVNNIAATHEKGPNGAAMGVALVAGGAVVGKAVMGAATAKGGAMAASKGFMGKTVMGKLAAPFVTKAAGAGAAVGAGAAGGAVAGPLGGLIGAVAGLGIDYTINAGVELMNRDAFVQDMHEALDATQLQWKQNLLAELERVVSVWLDDSIQLIADFDVQKR